MTAGTGVIHSEFNASATEPVHFFQIWIVPSAEDLEPSYQQFAYEPSEKTGRLRLIAGPERDTNPPSAFLHQDARLYAALLSSGDSLSYPIVSGRHAWVHCAGGNITVDGLALTDGDGVGVSDQVSLALRGAGVGGGELLLFDLA